MYSSPIPVVPVHLICSGHGQPTKPLFQKAATIEENLNCLSLANIHVGHTRTRRPRDKELGNRARKLRAAPGRHSWSYLTRSAFRTRHIFLISPFVPRSQTNWQVNYFSPAAINQGEGIQDPNCVSCVCMSWFTRSF